MQKVTLEAILRNSILCKNKLRRSGGNCTSVMSFHQQILKLKSFFAKFCWQFSAAVCLYNNAKTQQLSAISMTSILGTQEEKNQTTTTSGLIEKKWYTQKLYRSSTCIISCLISNTMIRSGIFLCCCFLSLYHCNLYWKISCLIVGPNHLVNSLMEVLLH